MEKRDKLPPTKERSSYGKIDRTPERHAVYDPRPYTPKERAAREAEREAAKKEYDRARKEMLLSGDVGAQYVAYLRAHQLQLAAGDDAAMSFVTDMPRSHFDSASQQPRPVTSNEFAQWLTAREQHLMAKQPGTPSASREHTVAPQDEAPKRRGLLARLYDLFS